MSLSEYRKIIFKYDERNCEEHPLHVCCDKIKWMTCFGKHESPYIVAMCHENERLKHKKKLFVTLHLRNIAVDDLNNGDESALTIITSNYFFNHYNIDKRNREYYIAPVKAFPLKDIVLGTTTKATFQWTKEKNFESGLMVSGTCLKSVLVRNNDEFLAPLHAMFGDEKSETKQHFRNLITLDTSPVDQGLININTAITVVKIDEVQCETAVKQFFDLNRNFEFSIAPLNSTHIKLLDQEVDESTDVFITRTASEIIGVEEDQVYNIVVNVDDEESPENEYLSIDICTNTQNQVKQRPVNIVIVDDNSFSSDTVYISRLLWLNFISNITVDETIYTCRLLPTLDIPPAASEIHVSLVLSPHYAADVKYDKCLLQYLKTPRIFCVGDVFSVPVEGDHEFYSVAAPQDMCSCSNIFYKVIGFGAKEAEDEITCCNVSMRDTNLYQDGATNSFVPLLVYNIQSYDINGLNMYADQLCEIILPYVDEPYNTDIPTVLLSGSASCGKKTIVSCVSAHMNMHIVSINCFELMSDSSGAMEGKITTALQKASKYLPCIIVLNNIECIGWDKDGERIDHRVCASFIKAFNKISLKDNTACMVVGVTTNKHRVVANLRPFFIHQVEVGSLDATNRRDILESIVGHLNYKPIHFDEIVKQTAGFVYGDLWALMRRSLLTARERIILEWYKTQSSTKALSANSLGSKLSWQEQENIGAAGVSARENDILKTLKQMQMEQAKIFGMPKVPTVKWSDIGGLEEAKKHIRDTIQLPLDHPELAATNLCRSGVLLYGPPGTGKTLLAKAVATQCSLNFLSVKGPELINMYVGQSEENVRQVFARAREAAPCVIFFDELDSLAPNRGRSGDSGGVMDRVVSQLLAELDGMQGEGDVHKHVFAIGATNRPDLVDPALLRPGRFDKMIYVSVNKNKMENLKVLQAQTKNVNLANDVDLEEIVQRCPDNMTGADFYALTSSAVMNALRKKIMILEEKDDVNSEMKIEVTHRDLIEAALTIVPSLSAQELRHYQTIQSNISEK